MKTFSTLKTLKVLLAHEKILFSVIAMMDRRGERFISEASLTLIVLDYMKSKSELEQEELKVAFATDNLLQAHILADKDSHNGVTRLIFQESVIGLFRLCETSLYQELTDSKLKSKLAALWRVQEQLESDSLSYSEQDPDYTEVVDDTLEQLSLLLDVLKRNVVRMKRLSQDLEQMSADACKSDSHFSQYREQLLENISHLFERHIKPTQSFLNPNVRFNEAPKGLGNLNQTLDDIRIAFESHGKNELADQVFRFSLSFGNIFQPIREVALQVDQFIRKTRASMAQFNALEHHYQKLTQAYQTTQVNLKKSRIDDSQAKDNGFVCGLKKQPKLKDFRVSDSPAYYANLFSEIELRLSDAALNQMLPAVDSEAWKDDSSEQALKRAMALYQFVGQLKLRPTDDLTAALHFRLKDVVEDYQLKDLLIAVNRMRLDHSEGGKGALDITTTNRKAYLNHNDELYFYRRKRVSAQP